MLRHPFDYLETLWQKPESTRKKILIVSVALISGVVITAWLMTFSIPSITPSSQNQAPVSNIWESLRQLPQNFFSNETISTETDNTSSAALLESATTTYDINYETR